MAFIKSTFFLDYNKFPTKKDLVSQFALNRRVQK